MAHLSLSFLGPFRVMLAGQTVTGFEYNRIRALLIYLAVEAERPHPREVLAGLLWPDWPNANALANLRHALAHLRQAIGDYQAEPPYLLISRETIQFNAQSDYDLDVLSFTRLAAPQRAGETHVEWLQQALALYRGPFLEGFTLSDSAAFEGWATLKREQLARQMLEVLGRLAAHHERRGEYEQAEGYAQRQLELDPLQEEAHRQWMRALALGGRRSAALAQYQSCRRVLAEELGVEPAPETTTLYESIRQGTLVPAAPLHEGPPPPPAAEKERAPRLSNLPAQAAPFVGREAEVGAIVSALRDPSCRLLSLVGLGGCGKTRLALEAAARLLPAGPEALFPQGVFWVSLAPLRAVDSIVPNIASAIGFSFARSGDRRSAGEQLRDHLRDKAMLLVLDNYEHLLEGAGLAAELLEAAPLVKILVTSRARLNLQPEQLLPTGGMEVPEALRADGDEDRRGVSEYGSVRLFLQGARRVRPGYEPTPEELATIAAICQQMHGLPLAILLAAAWMGILSPAEVAAEIGRSLDFLESDAPDLPQRQRSLRAAFEHSWRLLGPREREVFAALSVFRGSFTRQAACEVTGASLRDLRALADRSLLQTAAGGRYEVHEVLRQYAQERLEQSPAGAGAVRERHAEHYVALLQRWGARVHGADPTPLAETLFDKGVLDIEEVLGEIEPEIGNGLAAWGWIVSRKDAARIERAIGGLCRFLEQRGRNQEGKTISELAVQALASREQPEAHGPTSRPVLRALSLTLEWQGYFEWFTWEFAASLGTLQRSLSLYRELGDRLRMAVVLYMLGQVSHHSGRGDRQAQRWPEEALVIFRELGERIAAAAMLSLLGFYMAEEGRPEGAEAMVRGGLAIYEQAGVPEALNNAFLLGDVLIAEGRFAEAQTWLERALERSGEMPPRYAGFTYRAFGLALMHRGLYSQARAAFQRSVELCRQAAQDWDAARALHRLGDVALAEGAYADALEHYGRSIPLLRPSGGISLHGLGGPALAELGLGHTGRAGELFREDLRLAAAVDYPSWWAGALGAVALWLAQQGQPERAVEVYALAARQPLIAASRWWHDVVGQHIAAAAATLPTGGVATAQERGRGCDLQATLVELLAELEG